MSNETSVNSDIDVADDRIRGVRAIAEFCGDTIRHTQYLLETNRLNPVARYTGCYRLMPPDKERHERQPATSWWRCFPE